MSFLNLELALFSVMACLALWLARQYLQSCYRGFGFRVSFAEKTVEKILKGHQNLVCGRLQFFVTLCRNRLIVHFV